MIDSQNTACCLNYIRLCSILSVPCYRFHVWSLHLDWDGFLNSPRWMAPEILKGANYDISSDIYSFGVKSRPVASILWLAKRRIHKSMALWRDLGFAVYSEVVTCKLMVVVLGGGSFIYSSPCIDIAVIPSSQVILWELCTLEVPWADCVHPFQVCNHCVIPREVYIGCRYVFIGAKTIIAHMNAASCLKWVASCTWQVWSLNNLANSCSWFTRLWPKAKS